MISEKIGQQFVSSIALYVKKTEFTGNTKCNIKLMILIMTVEKKMKIRHSQSTADNNRVINWSRHVNNLTSHRKSNKKETDTFSFGITNQKNVPLAFTFDSTKSVNMVFNEDGGKVMRYVHPGEFTFLKHVEAAEGAEEFTLQYTVSMEEICRQIWHKANDITFRYIKITFRYIMSEI